MLTLQNLQGMGDGDSGLDDSVGWIGNHQPARQRDFLNIAASFFDSRACAQHRSNARRICRAAIAKKCAISENSRMVNRCSAKRKLK
jgi:hypothetical protein